MPDSFRNEPLPSKTQSKLVNDALESAFYTAYKHYRRAMDLKGRKVIALGERDGIPGTAIADLVRTAGADVVLTLTQCYV